MVEIISLEQWQEQIGKDQVTVAKFYTDWCPDCHRIDPFMPEVEEAYQGKIEFISINRDKFEELGKELDVFGIPSFIAFRNGRELIRFVSRQGKSRQEIEQFLDRVLQVSQAL
ncbi:co-chaperone YbbN [Ammoniphilus sp. CFH 90114]|uniref:thioredoxin family protein n=1 Tax=Ammoniphilus sp. CFH 90114 TaxID=2493665 RepID=UPI00100FB704|nr:thioredoxin family protein [Ammoniphilus sp. CFH 90114]RXT08069.1 thioredoxin [Ammoniphilus sp. CFH 90114]